MADQELLDFAGIDILSAADDCIAQRNDKSVTC